MQEVQAELKRDPMSGWSLSELDAQIVQAAGKRWEGGMGEDLPDMRCGFSTSDASLYSVHSRV
jgi:hypothetical protein